MKKLGKLSINPDKLMKNEELVNFKGGYHGYTACCLCSVGYSLVKYIVGSTSSTCNSDCQAIGLPYGEWVC